jgi:hypothetical protein
MVFKVIHVIQGQSPGSRSTTGSSSRKPTHYKYFFTTSTLRLAAILGGTKTTPCMVYTTRSGQEVANDIGQIK